LRPLLPALRIVGFVGAVLIIVVMAWRAARDLDASAITWWPMPLALASAAVWWLLGARGWSVLMTGRTSRREMSMWCRTQTLRYLPGGIWAPASRAIVVSGSLLDRLSAVATDNAIALCAAAAIGGVGLAAAGDPRWLPLALLVAVPYLAARLPANRTRIVPGLTLRATANYLVAFLAYALAAVLAQMSLSGSHDAVAVAGAAALAWSAGFVVVIAPSGVGVRELAYVALLSGTFSTAEATGAAIVLRLVTILAELAVLLAVGRPTSDPGGEERTAPGADR
jgi:hypothetical protein